jgi:hypothetical protein
MTAQLTKPRTPRVWLADATGRAGGEPVDRPVVRDHLMHQWEPDTDSTGYHTPDWCHHATWAELHARFDLVEVLGVTAR